MTETELEQLVQRYQRMVEGVALAAAGDPSVVDDVVQETFVVAWQRWATLRDKASVRAWLCQIARNVARKARRGRAREVAIVVEPASDETPRDAIEERERAEAVRAALARLAPRYRVPLVLFYYEQCSVKDVAEALAIREDAAMQRLSRGRVQLGEQLAAALEGELERRPSRKAGAVAAAVVAAVSLAGVRGAAAASTGVAAVAAAIGARWRPIGAVVATGAAVAIVWCATERSEAVAAKARVREVAAAPPVQPVAAKAEPASDVARALAALAPQLPASPYRDDRVVKNLVVGSPDPQEVCARATRGLIRAVFPTIGDDDYDKLASVLEPHVGATCAAWPPGEELYAICEATPADLLEGNVSCYPYDPFVVTACGAGATPSHDQRP